MTPDHLSWITGGLRFSARKPALTHAIGRNIKTHAGPRASSVREETRPSPRIVTDPSAGKRTRLLRGVVSRTTPAVNDVGFPSTGSALSQGAMPPRGSEPLAGGHVRTSAPPVRARGRRVSYGGSPVSESLAFVSAVEGGERAPLENVCLLSVNCHRRG